MGTEEARNVTCSHLQCCGKYEALINHYISKIYMPVLSCTTNNLLQLNTGQFLQLKDIRSPSSSCFGRVGTSKKGTQRKSPRMSLADDDCSVCAAGSPGRLEAL